MATANLQILKVLYHRCHSATCRGSLRKDDSGSGVCDQDVDMVARLAYGLGSVIIGPATELHDN